MAHDYFQGEMAIRDILTTKVAKMGHFGAIWRQMTAKWPEGPLWGHSRASGAQFSHFSRNTGQNGQK